jgi:hypothetical protein
VKKYRPSKEDKQVFLDFHGTDQSSRDYAKAKLASGTAPLYPESVAWMRRVTAQRKLVQATADALEAKDKAEREAARAK